MLLAATLGACSAGIARLTRLPVAAVAAALGTIGWQPSSVPPGGDPYSGMAAAARVTAAQNAAYRAAYVIKSAGRIGVSVSNGRSLEDAILSEKRFAVQQQAAGNKRTLNANRVDSAAAVYGDELGWYAVLDSRTDPQCRKADGNNFRASSPPSFGYPGAVHPHCRCRPGKRFARGRLMR